jgi:hypothetical protein
MRMTTMKMRMMTMMTAIASMYMDYPPNMDHNTIPMPTMKSQSIQQTNSSMLEASYYGAFT